MIDRSLSQLADIARELTQPRNAHYPIKRRGEKRKLHPNRAGIEWLEGKAFKSDTEIVYTETLGVPEDCLKATYASGQSQKLHSRPMFQVLDGSAFSGLPVRRAQGCASCDDFARSWSCEEHQAVLSGN